MRVGEGDVLPSSSSFLRNSNVYKLVRRDDYVIQKAKENLLKLRLF